MTQTHPGLSLRAYIFRTLHRTALTFSLVVAAVPVTAQAPAQIPAVRLIPAPAISLPGAVDSNSPVVWDLVDGVTMLHVLTSFAGEPSLASGVQLPLLGPPSPVSFVSHPGHGLWMESVLVDEGGTWYGYYHNEVPAGCSRPELVVPRIGAARSRDQGATWEDLGPILEAPPGWHTCSTPNKYFAGGVGDVSVLLDRDSKDLYLYYSQYATYPAAQGVAIARLPWADRDEPQGKVTILNSGVWLSATELSTEDENGDVRTQWFYPFGTPLVAPSRPWHDADKRNDAFWGASVHWNVSLQRYVMLLNRTKDEQFAQEGIYVSFASRLDDAAAWSTPTKILDGGSWYPQVIGVEVGEGSDKQAARRARLFLGGRSTHVIEFIAR
jgi:hypothetical protein